jgi:hypothetical protein
MFAALAPERPIEGAQIAQAALKSLQSALSRSPARLEVRMAQGFSALWFNLS